MSLSLHKPSRACHVRLFTNLQRFFYIPVSPQTSNGLSMPLSPHSLHKPSTVCLCPCLFTNLQGFAYDPVSSQTFNSLSMSLSPHKPPTVCLCPCLFTNLQQFVFVPVSSQTFNSSSITLCLSLLNPSRVDLCPSLFTNLQQFAYVPVSSPTFKGSSGCQHTAMPGAVSLNTTLSSPARLHTRHVRSSLVLANWSSSPGAKVTELTKSVWPTNTWIDR